MDRAEGFQIDVDEEPPSPLFLELAEEAREYEPDLRLLSVIVTPPHVPDADNASAPPRDAKLIFCWEGLDGGFCAELPLGWMRYRALLRRHAAETMAARGT